MIKNILIPDEVFSCLYNSTNKPNGRFYQSMYLSLTNPFIEKWFEEASKLFEYSISPRLVYATSVKHNEHQFTLKHCKACGKVLSIDKLLAEKDCCSLKCTKALPENKEKARARMTNPVTLEKRRQTWLKKYGTTVPARLESVKNKAKETCLKKYGTEYVYQSKHFKDKRHQVCLDRYGNEEPFAADSVKEKIIKSSVKTRKENHFDIFLAQLKNKNIEYLSTKEEYVKADKPLKFKCNYCGNIWIRSLDSAYGLTNTQHIYCSKCNNIISKQEKSLLIFIKSIYSGTIIENDRTAIKPKELDIYLPEKKLAFEFNGTYWHSSAVSTDYKYHQQKTLECNKKGIRLIHIFEHEWVQTPEKIKALIKSALGIFDVHLYARQCQVKEISSKEYSTFLNTYHLQGSVNSSVRLGLFYKEELIAAIGFGKSRFKKDEVELHRFCVRSGYQVVGGFSKLIKHSSFTKFISYVDLAHYTGEGYKQLGFTVLSITKPAYKYIKGDIILSRMKCQKHKLEALLKDAYDPKKSEAENMLLAGWHKVYDCGNLKLLYEAS